MLFRDITVIDENFEVRNHCYVGVRGDKIAYLSDELPKEDFGEVYGGRDKVLLPGFVNAHCHVAMTLLRGYAEGLPLDRWLHEKVFPFEAQIQSEHFYYGAMLGIAEMLACGVTSFSEMYFSCEEIARAVAESGIKCNLAVGVTSPVPPVPFEDNLLVRHMFSLFKRWDGAKNGRIKIDTCLHAEYTTDEETVRGMARLAKEKGSITHVHLSETREEHEGCKARRGGRTPARYFADCGLLESRAHFAHGVYLEEGDRELLRAAGASVAHCPASNLKLGSGVTDVPALLKSGVNVAIGTDGAASNNNLDMLSEMRLCSLLGKGIAGDPCLLPPREVLYMATRAGALSQGREDCGLIKEGFRADLTVLDLHRPHIQPVHDVLGAVVFGAKASDVVLTMCDGRVLYKDGVYLTLGEESIMAGADRSAKEILNRIGPVRQIESISE
ncbi:amidohydrolase family protein [Zongyangia hominis]|uniref:Amidohydrolase n=1 Tax=Zongyangia hominis TaxID=2763677 RepID=A0A926ECF2_9FIRM|nr:amidohydrolase [Zongyangia hominis]MBC8569809.1 amidohydrolase [Zongyangia hominis]